jgi:phage gpG-like protein
MQIILGSGNLSKLLANLKAKIEDITPLNAEISEVLISSVHENFLVGGRYSRVGSFNGGNTSWQDLSDVTKKAREKIKKWPGQLLRVSGRLFNSIVTKVTKDSAQVGTNLEYARTHQYGAKRGSLGTKTVTVKSHTKTINGKKVTVKSHQKRQQIPWGDIPARPFLVVQEEDLSQIGDMIMNRIMQLDNKG